MYNEKLFENLVNEFWDMDFYPTLTTYKFKTANKNTTTNTNSETTSNYPFTNLYEDKWVYRYEVFTPGLTKDDVSLEINGNLLTLSSEKTNDDKKSKGTYLTKEYYTTKFTRTYKLPEDAVLEEINAKTENGITTIYVPREKSTKTGEYTRTITVE
jgi:HSP20 family protein